MGDIIDTKSQNLSMKTYNAYQSVKYELLASEKGAMAHFRKEDFLKDSPGPVLYSNMVKSWRMNEEAKEERRKELEEKKKELELAKVIAVSKRKAKE